MITIRVKSFVLNCYLPTTPPLPARISYLPLSASFQDVVTAVYTSIINSPSCCVIDTSTKLSKFYYYLAILKVSFMNFFCIFLPHSFPFQVFLNKVFSLFQDLSYVKTWIYDIGGKHYTRSLSSKLRYHLTQNNSIMHLKKWKFLDKILMRLWQIKVEKKTETT